MSRKFLKSSAYKTRQGLEKAFKKNVATLNNRIKSLDKVGYNNDVIEEIKEYNAKQGRWNGKFSSATKNKTIEELKKENDFIVEKLHNNMTTLRGNDNDFKQRINKLIILDSKNKTGKDGYYIDDDYIEMLSDRQKKILLDKQIQIANKRIKELNKHDIENKEVNQLKVYNLENNKKELKKFYSDYNKNDLEEYLKFVTSFNQHKSTNVEKRLKAQDKTLERFKEKGLNIPKGKEQEFFNFLDSGLYSALKDVEESEKVIDLAYQLIENDVDISQLNKKFEEYFSKQLTSQSVSKKIIKDMEKGVRRKRRNGKN